MFIIGGITRARTLGTIPIKPSSPLCERCHEVESKCRGDAEQIFLASCKDTLTHRDLLALAIVFKKLRVPSRDFVETLLLTPAAKLIAAAKSVPIDGNEQKVIAKRWDVLIWCKSLKTE